MKAVPSLSIAVAALLSAATPAAAAENAPAAPLLRLEQAVETAYRNNHLLASTTRGVSEAEERAAAIVTRRLPSLEANGFGGRLLNSFQLAVPLGGLGTSSGFPTKDNSLTVPASWGGAAMVSPTQPLTQQYRIGLRLDIAHLDREIAQEDVRRERQQIAAEVRTTYYQISAREAGIVALRDLVRSVEELDVVTSRYFSEGMVLRSDALEVKARLARERQRLETAESGLAAQREHLNQLLGRDVLDPFRVVTPSELVPAAASLSLEAARQRAETSRAEVRTAALRTSQADTSRRLANAGWIPDVSLVAAYTRLMNSESTPQNIGAVGITFSWEAFDWGRKYHEAKESEYATERARENRIETEQQIVVDVGQRWRAVRDAAALLEATRLQEEASQASLETDQRRYRENAAILRDLLRTEALLSSARSDFTDALAGYWSAVAELERVVGNED
ncbi:MAG TPA: TolC family protein [Myxococcales bacterium]|nr:TolC family protein [Myxococcales bacterium]